MLGKLAALQQTSAQEVDAARESIKWPPHRRLGTASQALLTTPGLMRVKPGVVHGFSYRCRFHSTAGSWPDGTVEPAQFGESLLSGDRPS